MEYETTKDIILNRMFDAEKRTSRNHINPTSLVINIIYNHIDFGIDANSDKAKAIDEILYRMQEEGLIELAEDPNNPGKPIQVTLLEKGYIEVERCQAQDSGE